MYKHIYINSSKGICVDVVIQENINHNIFIWPSSLVLSAYLVSNSLLCLSRTFFEVGSGVGLPSIVAAKLGASECFITEKSNEDDVQLNLLNYNIGINNLEKICHAQTFNWGDILNTVKCDFILGSDVFYSTEDFDSIIATVQSFLSTNRASIFLTTYHQRR